MLLIPSCLFALLLSSALFRNLRFITLGLSVLFWLLKIKGFQRAFGTGRVIFGSVLVTLIAELKLLIRKQKKIAREGKHIAAKLRWMF